MPAKFDYGHLTPEARQLIQDAAAKIKRLGKKTIKNLIEIGRYLHEVRELLPRGQWGIWLETEFEWSETSTRRFIDIFTLFESTNLADLPRMMTLAPSSIALLAARSTPESARREVYDKIEEGKALSHKNVKQVIERHKKGNDDSLNTSTSRNYEAPEPELLKVLRSVERALPPGWKATSAPIIKEFDRLSDQNRKALLVQINHLWPALLTLRSLYNTQRVWCSLCHKSDQEVTNMFRGKVFGAICNECVAAFAAEIQQIFEVAQNLQTIDKHDIACSECKYPNCGVMVAHPRAFCDEHLGEAA